MPLILAVALQLAAPLTPPVAQPGPLAQSAPLIDTIDGLPLTTDSRKYALWGSGGAAAALGVIGATVGFASLGPSRFLPDAGATTAGVAIGSLALYAGSRLLFASIEGPDRPISLGAALAGAIAGGTASLLVVEGVRARAARQPAGGILAGAAIGVTALAATTFCTLAFGSEPWLESRASKLLVSTGAALLVGAAGAGFYALAAR